MNLSTNTSTFDEATSSLTHVAKERSARRRSTSRGRALRSFRTASLGLLFAVLGFSSAHAQEATDCAQLFREVDSNAIMTGTIVGKADRWMAVQQFTTPEFDATSWRPAERTVPSIDLRNNGTYFRTQTQAVQTYVTNGRGSSGDFDLWFYDSGSLYSRSLTWNDGWSQWQNVRCYRAPSLYSGATRFFVTAFIPAGGWLVTLDIQEDTLI